MAAMVLSLALDPVSQRLVQHIRAGQFVEMRELLGGGGGGRVTLLYMTS